MLALVVIEAAHQIYRVEVRGLGHGLHGAGILLVDLDALQNLQAGAAVLSGNHIRAATGLSLVLHHAAYADGPVQLGAEHLHPLGLGMGQRHLDAQFLVQEVLNLIAKRHGGILVQLSQVIKNPVSELQGHTHQHLLVLCGNGQELLVRHIVYILDAHQLIGHLVQVVDEGAVSGGAEEKGAVGLAERLVVRGDGNGVRGLVLEGEADVVLDTVFLLIVLLDGADSLLKQRLVLRRNGHGEVAGTVGITHVFLRLHQMFGDGRPHLVRITVEFQDALGLAAIGQSVLFQQLLQRLEPIIPAVFGSAEDFRRIEGEILDTGGQTGAGRVGRQVFPLFQIGQALEHVLEHAGGGAGGRDKLALSVHIGLFVIIYRGFDGLGIQNLDAPFRGGGPYDLHPGEAVFEMLNLLFYLTEGSASVQDLLLVGLAEHGVIVVINIKFSPVVVFAAQFFKRVGGAAEEEVVRKDGIVVLHHSGDFSLGAAPEVQRSGRKRLILQSRAEIHQFLYPVVSCKGLHRHGRSVLLPLIGIAGNVRGGYVTQLYQVGVHLGFIAPGIQYEGPQLGTRMDQGLLIHHLPAGGIDEDGARTDFFEEVLPRHATGGLVQRDMQRHHRSFLQEFI